jgi:putative Mn2+ efflux pump MntP
MPCEGKKLTERLQEIEVFLYSFLPAYDLRRLSTSRAGRGKPTKHSFYILGITAVNTSIDAMAVGVSLAFMDVNIFVTAAAIGLATFTMVTISVMLGRLLELMFGKRSEVVGGLVMIAIGVYILKEHLG